MDSHTTVTGLLHHLIEKRTFKDKVSVVLWSLVITGTIIGFAVTINSLIRWYATQPISLQIIRRGEEFVWPDITICLSSRLDEDRMSLSTNQSLVSQWEQRFNFYYEFWREVNENHLNDTSRLIHDYKNWALLQSYQKDKELVFKQVQDVIFLCQFKGLECTFVNFTVMHHPSWFNCFIFRPADRVPGFPGRSNGLKLLLHFGASNRDYRPSAQRLERFRGFQISVHPPNTLPDFNRNSIELSTGTRLDLELSMTYIKRLNRTSDKCFPMSASDIESPYFESSYTDCEDQSAQLMFSKRCHCQSPDHFLYNSQEFQNLTSCLTAADQMWEELRQNLSANQSVNMRQMVTQQMKHQPAETDEINKFLCYKNYQSKVFEGENDKVRCQTLCREMEYRTFSSSNVWPIHSRNAFIDIRDSFLRNLALAKNKGWDTTLLQEQFNEVSNLFKDQSFDHIKKKKERRMKEKLLREKRNRFVQRRYALLMIYMSSVFVDVLNEQEAYPWTNLMSDIGGSMGMWIGISFITIVHFLEFVIFFISQIIWKRKSVDVLKEKN